MISPNSIIFFFFFLCLNRFSVNFTLECNPTPQNIAYHFKTVFSENKVVHNYKTVGNWHNEVEDANTWIQNTGGLSVFRSKTSHLLVISYLYDCL